MAEKKIDSYIRVGPRGVGETVPLAPAGVPPVLRRFWNFARDMAKRFTKNLLKDRTDDFIKVVRKDLEGRV